MLESASEAARESLSKQAEASTKRSLALCGTVPQMSSGIGCMLCFAELQF